jgi:hypothetical protein
MGPLPAPLVTFNLEQNTRSAREEPSHNENRPRANTHGDACVNVDPTSAEDTADESIDLTNLDTEDEEVLEEDGPTVEE